MINEIFAYLATSTSHILIDTILIIFVLYLLLHKSYNPKSKVELNEKVNKNRNLFAFVLQKTIIIQYSLFFFFFHAAKKRVD